MAAGRLSDGFWASVLQWSRLGMNALVFLVVARFLSLAEIGAFATAAAPLRFFQVIHKSGIEDSVVILPDRRVGLDALFWLSIGLGLTVIVISIAIGSGLSYLMPDDAGIGPMLAVLSLTSLCHGIGAVPDGLLRRDGQFRTLALRTLSSQGIAALATIVALWAGAGAWALVIFTLINGALATAISVVIAGWQPSRRWPTKGTMSPALRSTVTLSGRVLIGAAVQPVLQIGVGAASGLAAAGIFQIALRVLALLDAVTLAPIRFVALPRFSRLTGDQAAQRTAILASLGLAGAFSAYVYLGTFAAAPDMLAVLVGGTNAGPTVPVLQMLCLSGLGSAAAAVINQALIGGNLGAAAVRLSILQAVATFGLTFPVLNHSVTAVAVGLTLAGLAVLAIILIRLPHWFGISGLTALRVVSLPYLAGALMVLGVMAADRWVWADWSLLLRLTAQILAGTAIYICALRVVAPQTLSLLWPGKSE